MVIVTRNMSSRLMFMWWLFYFSWWGVANTVLQSGTGLDPLSTGLDSGDDYIVIKIKRYLILLEFTYMVMKM